MDVPDNRNKTGKWIKNRFHEDLYTCSECAIQTCNKYWYCPGCGAKMDMKECSYTLEDVKKVIKDLVTIKTCCKNMKNEEKYNDIDREMYADWEYMIENTITLLKKQKTVVKE